MSNAHIICCLIFTLTYCGIAIGGFPGLAIDRTGIAVLGAIAMVGFGVLSLPQALQSIDSSTILLLFGLMLVSAQLQLSGFYRRAASLLAFLTPKPKLFLAVLMGVSGGLSAVLVNDIVCLVFTPVVVAAVLKAQLNPFPFLLALACASNIGSASTLIGNPQNMLIGQVGQLSFSHFLAWSATPVLISMAVAYGIILALYRGRLRVEPQLIEGHHHLAHGALPSVKFNGYQTAKGLLVTVVVMVCFFTSIPREITALCAGGLLLCSRSTQSKKLLGLIDWSLILLFCGLFIVIAGMDKTGVTGGLINVLEQHGVVIDNPYTLLAIGPILGNIVSNVPAVMMLIQFLNAAPHTSWYVLGVASTFAGNLITIGSIANLIVIEEAKRDGIVLSFREHARVGIPVTIASLVILLGWLALTGVLFPR
jgi:Na+/H+ antiporter NhaD/arsenite permease-like protein